MSIIEPEGLFSIRMHSHTHDARCRRPSSRVEGEMEPTLVVLRGAHRCLFPQLPRIWFMPCPFGIFGIDPSTDGDQNT